MTLKQLKALNDYCKKLLRFTPPKEKLTEKKLASGVYAGVNANGIPRIIYSKTVRPRRRKKGKK